MSHPIQFTGSRMAQWVLRRLGWTFHFEGLPTPQGVVVVYPHTSNWDFIIGILLKWSMGIEAHFWGKDSLFRIPVLGYWIRWLGGIPIRRHSSHGVVSETIAQMQTHSESGKLLWLAVAPEGTRSLTPGWRTGFYQVALGAGVPVGIARLDWGQKTLDLTHFVTLTGDMGEDFARMAQVLKGVTGIRADQAGPVQPWIKTMPPA